MLKGDTPDVSELTAFKFYQRILFVSNNNPNTKQIPANQLLRGRYLGPAYHYGSTMCHWIRLPDGTKIARSLVRADNTSPADSPPEEEEEKSQTEDQLYWNGEEGIPLEENTEKHHQSVTEEVDKSTSNEEEENSEDEDADDEETDDEPAITNVVGTSAWIKKGDKYITVVAVADSYTPKGERLITVRIQGKADEIWPFEEFKKLSKVTDAQRGPVESYSFVRFGRYKVNVKGQRTKTLHIQTHWTGGYKPSWIPFEDLKVDDPVTLAAYAIANFSNLSKYSKAKEHAVILNEALKWAKEFLSKNDELAVNALSTKKPSAKFGVNLPKGNKGAEAEDLKYNQDPQLSALVDGQRWSAAREKELANFDKHNAFRYLPKGSHQPEGYQSMRCHFVYDVKADGTFKARFCAGGDTVDSTGVHSAMTVVETTSTKVLFTIAKANKQEVLVGDLSSAYLHAYTQEKVCFFCGPEWGDKEGCWAIVVKAVYGLVGSAHAYHQHVFETMTGLGWKSCELDKDIWMRTAHPNSEGKVLRDYVAFYVDDFIVVSDDPLKIGEELGSIFSIKEIGKPNRYLGADVKLVGENYRFSSETYLKEVISQLTNDGAFPGGNRPDGIKKRKTPSRTNNPMVTEDHPENDDSELLTEREHRLYQRLVGILQWLVTLGRFDITYAVASLSRFNSAPRIGHLERAYRVFGYLQTFPNKSVEVNAKALINLPEMEKGLAERMKKVYPDAEEDVSINDPEPLGLALALTVYADSDHAHDHVTRRSISGILVFIASTPIMAKSSRQAAVESSTYSAEFYAARTATEVIIGLRLLLRALGVPGSGPTKLLGDNMGVVQSATLFTSCLKKKHNAISYHRVREAVAAGTISYAHINTKANLADILTKPLDSKTLGDLRDTFLHRLTEDVQLSNWTNNHSPSEIGEECQDLQWYLGH